MDGDDRLRDAFAELRQRREVQAPDLDAVLERQRRTAVPWVWAVASAAGLALAFGVLVDRGGRADRQFYAQLDSVTGWRAATDVFLPARDGVLYGGVPPLGHVDLEIYAGPSVPAARSAGEEEGP